MSFALDVNLLLYASDTSSPYFERARQFVESRMAQRVQSSGLDVLLLH